MESNMVNEFNKNFQAFYEAYDNEDKKVAGCEDMLTEEKDYLNYIRNMVTRLSNNIDDRIKKGSEKNLGDFINNIIEDLNSLKNNTLKRRVKLESFLERMK